DSLGQAFVTGSTDSTDFPTTPGAYSTTPSSYQNVFVTKLDAGGASLIYSTYIGGSSIDDATAIAVDSSGNAYVAGSTSSTDYPTTPGATDSVLVQTPFHLYDAFVTKLNAAGTGLLYSTFVGGSKLEWGYSIAVDSSGNAY